MTTQTPSAEAPVSKRRTVPIIILILATLIAAVSVIALWVKRQALETDTWVETSTELLEDKAIQDALADFVVNTIYENVDVQGEIASALPPRAQLLAGPISGGLRQVATRATEEALEQEKVQGLWEDANRVAHERLLALIEDEGEFLSTTDGEVTLDLTSLVSDVAANVGIGGDVASKLPEGAAHIEILHSDELEAAQKGVKLLKTLAWFLTALALVLYAVAIWSARGWRREMLRAVGFSFIAIGVIDLLARNAGGDAVVGSLSEASTADTAVLHAWEIGTSLLKETAESLIIYGLVMVFAAWLAGPSKVSTSMRYALTPYLRQPKYAYMTLAGILILLFWWNPVVATSRLLPSLVLVLVLAIGIEALRRQMIREFPDHVSTGTPEGIAQALADRMRESRERRVAGRAAPSAAVPGALSGASRVEELERLAKLHQSGVLTDDELAAEKARVLGAS
jgi:hypothetical protein